MAQKVRYLSMHWSWIIPGFTRNIYPRILQPSWKITGSEITCPGTGFPITFHSVFTSEIPSATCFFQRKTSCFSFLKSQKESLQVTLTFSYIREFMLENTGQLIEKLENWCEENKVILEIQVNDWAMAEMLKGKSLLVPALGILLNKRRKDPRLHYKTGTMEQIGADADKYLSENNLNADFTGNI